MAKRPSANPRIPTARQAQPGMQVRQQALDLLGQASPHVILNTERKGDLNSQYFVITTNYGQWSFYPDELVTFPRRPDNSKRDWRGEVTPPRPLDLAVGDVLHGRYGPDLPGTDQASADRNAQRVTAVTYNRARPKIITVTTYSAEDGPLSTPFLPDEPVIYPRPERERPSTDSPQPAVPEGFGPYQDPNDQDRLLYLVVHPSAGGRWPRYLQAPIPLGHNTFLARPPKTAPPEPWPQFVGTQNYSRHPKDPAWGLPVIAAIDPERLTEAEQAYADYRARVPTPPQRSG